MFKEGRETDAVVGNMRLFADDENVELSLFCILLDDLFTADHHSR